MATLSELGVLLIVSRIMDSFLKKPKVTAAPVVAGVDKFMVRDVVLPLKLINKTTTRPPGKTFCYLTEKTKESVMLCFEQEAINPARVDINQLWDYGQNEVEKTANIYGEGRTFVNRKQCTFGCAYTFAGQNSQAHFPGEEEKWPAAVRLALADARAKSTCDFNSVHCNWYNGQPRGPMAP